MGGDPARQPFADADPEHLITGLGDAHEAAEKRDRLARAGGMVDSIDAHAVVLDERPDGLDDRLADALDVRSMGEADGQVADRPQPVRQLGITRCRGGTAMVFCDLGLESCLQEALQVRAPEAPVAAPIDEDGWKAAALAPRADRVPMHACDLGRLGDREQAGITKTIERDGHGRTRPPVRHRPAWTRAGALGFAPYQ